MNLLPKHPSQCPYLFLAPMEGVGDSPFRKAMRSVGGFDEAVRDFLRVPKDAHVPSLAKAYNALEITPIPLAAQLMGSDCELMAKMAVEMERRGAPRIDLNCGCPSNTVTGRGAGSSLLKDPYSLYQIARAMKKAVTIPVTIKMRSGYEDTSLFEENLLAAEESGASFITLHPRTKVDGYGPPAQWELIAKAKSLLKIPVVGSGDVVDVESALGMLQTGCDALMIGRGALINPFIFHEIKSYFAGNLFHAPWEECFSYLQVYLKEIPLEMPARCKINKLKQLFSFLFKKTKALQTLRTVLLTCQEKDPERFANFAFSLIQQGWS